MALKRMGASSSARTRASRSAAIVAMPDIHAPLTGWSDDRPPVKVNDPLGRIRRCAARTTVYRPPEPFIKLVAEVVTRTTDLRATRRDIEVVDALAVGE